MSPDSSSNDGSAAASPDDDALSIVGAPDVEDAALAMPARKRPKPGDWSPGEAGMLTAFFGNYRKPPAIDYRWLVLCLDRATGKILWQQTAHEGKPPIPIHAQNTYAT